MTQPRLWAPARPGVPLVEVIAGGAVGEAPLPDDPPPSSTGVNWAPGALAGVLAHHAAPASGTDEAGEHLIAALDRHRQQRLDRTALELTYQLLADGQGDVGPRAARAVLAHVRADDDPARGPVLPGRSATWAAG